MAGPVPGGDDKTPERIIHRVEAHEDRVAEQQLGMFSAMLHELEQRIAETTQMRVQAAATLIEDKVARHTETIVAAVGDFARSVNEAMTTALSSTRAGIERHVGDKIAASAVEINKQTTAASQQVQDSFDKRANATDQKVGAASLDIKEWTTKQANDASQLIQAGFDKRADTTDGKIGAASLDIKAWTTQQTNAASQLIQAGFDKRADTTDGKIGTATLDIKEWTTKQTAAGSQLVQDTVGKLASATDEMISGLPANLAKMLNTMEVSVLARLLGLIDTRLKAIEAQLAGYAGPEQEMEDLSEWKSIAAKALGEATELVEIANTAVAEAAKADTKTADEYFFLAGQSFGLALSRANEVAGIATREAEHAHDAKAKAEAGGLEQQASGLIQKAQEGLGTLRHPEVQQP